jgi:hypothetical protein
MSDYVYQDQLNPDGYVLTVTSSGTGSLDLSTIASATFKVRREADGSESSWTCTLSDQSASSLTLTYLFTAGDIDTVRGVYDIYARMLITATSKPQRTATQRFVVKGKYEI